MAVDQKLIEFVIKKTKDYAHTLDHNKILFDIYEGNLLEYVLQDLNKQLSKESYDVVCHRVAPINVLTKIISKLSTIYSKSPKRTVVDGGKQDEELLAYYEDKFNMNSTMGIANELFNLHKSTTLEPFISEGEPKLRAVPSDRSLALSQDQTDPTNRTIWVKLMGKRNYNGKEEEVLYIYTDTDFIPITMGGEILIDVLRQQENPEAINPYMEIPSTYINRSNHCIVPQIDTDVLRMTKIIPLLISDLNYAVMFQSFSIIYGIDLDTTNVKMSPNALWNFKSDSTKDHAPSVGVIKPSVDIAEVVQFIQAQLAFWLDTKNIRPGSIGGLSGENFASGISKIIDEMDTSEDRQKQVQYFTKAEGEFWELIINYMHPYWMSQKLIDTNLNFSPGVSIKTEFQEQIPLTQRTDMLNDIVLELTNKLTTQKEAIKRLNPEMEDKEIDALIAEIEAENTSTVVVPNNNPFNNTQNPQDNSTQAVQPQDNLNGGQALPV